MFNVSDPTEPKLWKPEWIGAKAFLDGKEIPWVFYADEERGIIKTYWIEGFMSPEQQGQSAGGLVAKFYQPEMFSDREVSCNKDDVLRETLRGKVTIQLP